MEIDRVDNLRLNGILKKQKASPKYSLLISVVSLLFVLTGRNVRKYAFLDKDYLNQNPFLISLLRLHHKETNI